MIFFSRSLSRYCIADPKALSSSPFFHRNYGRSLHFLQSCSRGEFFPTRFFPSFPILYCFFADFDIFFPPFNRKTPNWCQWLKISSAKTTLQERATNFFRRPSSTSIGSSRTSAPSAVASRSLRGLCPQDRQKSCRTRSI